PLAALSAAVIQLDDAVDDVIVLACDLPLAGPVVRRLAALGQGALAMADGQPLCSRWPRAAFATGAADLVERGERRMWSVVDALRPQAIDVTDEELLNVNTPADLARAATLLRTQGLGQ